MLIDSFFLNFNTFRKCIEVEGCNVSPFDVCAANKTMSGKQHALTWHVDDAKESHKHSEENDIFCKIGRKETWKR